MLQKVSATLSNRYIWVLGFVVSLSSSADEIKVESFKKLTPFDKIKGELLRKNAKAQAAYYMSTMKGELKYVVPLGFKTFHTQGLHINEIKGNPNEGQFILTTTDTKNEKGHLIRFDVDPKGAKVETELNVTLGTRHHPGGIDQDPKTGRIYFGVSDYKAGIFPDKDGPTTILSVDPKAKKLEYKKHFVLGDHTGTMLCDRDGKCFDLYGIDWTVNLYTVRLEGEGAIKNTDLAPRNKFAPKSPVEHQDCKGLGGHYYLCAGKVGGIFNRTGKVQLIYADAAFGADQGKDKNGEAYQVVPFHVVKEFTVPNVSKGKIVARGGVPLTYNATDFRFADPDKKGRPQTVWLYSAPEDGPNTHLYIYKIPVSYPEKRKGGILPTTAKELLP